MTSSAQAEQRQNELHVAVVFGGPSAERNISAGSIKPWVTFLHADPTVNLTVLFVAQDRSFWELPEEYYFTNTCEDFESQLFSTHQSLTETRLPELLKSQDIVIPLIHGEYGEDGQFQKFLDSLNVTYLFSEPEALRTTLDKSSCYEALNKFGISIPPYQVIEPDQTADFVRSSLSEGEVFHGDSNDFVVVKPLSGGSSIGVSIVELNSPGFDAALSKARASDPQQQALLEPVIQGREFSTIVLEDADGRPIALAPTGVQSTGDIFDTRQKYLHGSGAHLYTPMSDDLDEIHRVRELCAQTFSVLGMRTMARVDGWVDETGRILISDVNGISGMSFSSFAFLQTSMIGLSHYDLITRLIRSEFPDWQPTIRQQQTRESIMMVFGGPTSERQVSRQSGIFTALCLGAIGYNVDFVLMDMQCEFIPVGLFLALHHEVEEIQELTVSHERMNFIRDLAREISRDLGEGEAKAAQHLHVGERTDFVQILQKKAPDLVFLGLHGGPGEDGTLQVTLETLGFAYNGPNASASRVSMDKVMAVNVIRSAEIPGVKTPRQHEFLREEFLSVYSTQQIPTLFSTMTTELGSDALIVKPSADGCSTGVALIHSAEELQSFITSILSGSPVAITNRGAQIQMPIPSPQRWIIEEALVDDVSLPNERNRDGLAKWFREKQYIEITTGVLQRGTSVETMIPALTLAGADVLSLEEKFQQGGGVNISLDAFDVPSETVSSIRHRVKQIAQHLGITGYSRIDCIWDQQHDELYFLEANTLCGLTEATVFYSQALHTFGLAPSYALEQICRAAQHAKTERDLTMGTSKHELTEYTSFPMAVPSDVLARAVGGTAHGDPVTIHTIVIDSREANDTSLFVPLSGERDGHDFIDDARAAGARAWLTSGRLIDDGAIHVRDTYDALVKFAKAVREEIPGQVIGITGSVGKTTTKDLTASALRAQGNVHASEHSFNNEIGVPLTLANSLGATHVVLEMGIHNFGDIAYLCRIASPTIGVVTRVARAHTQWLATLEGVAQAKAELVQALPASGFAVLNMDDEFVAAMAQQTIAQVIGYSATSKRGEVFASQVSIDNEGHPIITAHTPWGVVQVRSPLPGEHMVTNMLAALSVAGLAGVDIQEAAGALELTETSKWRLERRVLSSGAVLINDAYNANPTSMMAALDVLSRYAGRRIAIVGEMAELGPDSELDHQQIVEYAHTRGIELLAVETHAYRGVLSVTLDEVVVRISELSHQDAVLIKGSRVTRLERVAEVLTTA